MKRINNTLLCLLVILFLYSCSQNETKQKELELKERELTLKEKEFALKQQDTVSKQSQTQTTEADTKQKVSTIPVEHINSLYREIVQNWLLDKPGWRPGVENDAYEGATNEGREFLKGEIKSMTNHPFYVAADLNKNGKEDFIIMLVKKVGKMNKFAIAIFNSAYEQLKPNPAFYTENVSDGEFIYWEGNDLLLSPPASHGALIKPHGKSYVFQFASEEE
ncbi:MAG: hypothetical protein IPP81_20035 [Chitinophagaceae bacterium]|nr:hypothetical protein [Chitinophagaceae bacterium]